MENGKIAAGALIVEAGRQFAAHWKLIALTFLGLIVAALIHLAIGFAVISLAQFELTCSILADRNLLHHGFSRRRFVASLGVQVIVFAIVATGWTLMILPGIYLMLRLYFAVPSLIAEEIGVFAALTASWHQTKGQELLLLFATLVAGMVAILPWILMIAAVLSDAGSAAVLVMVLAALVIGTLVPIYWACVAAVGYAGIVPDMRALEEVFS
jgi:membrane-anchored glycerophosphoryl diester phosphodiesterase (GDPDase)